MYQFALVKMLHNTVTQRWHPIMYFDSHFPGPIEEQKLMRYKSKGHHTTGFDKREDAIVSANELIEKLRTEHHDTVLVELEEKEDLIWNDNEMPIDIQLRPLPQQLQK